MKNRRCHFCKRRQRGGSWQCPPAPRALRGHRSCAPQSQGREKAPKPVRGRGPVTTEHQITAAKKSRGEPPALWGPFLKGEECCRSISAQPLAPQTHPFRVTWALQSKALPGHLGRALPEVCSPQHTLLNANLLPGFVGTQEAALFGGYFPTALLSAFRQTPSWPALTIQGTKITRDKRLQLLGWNKDFPPPPLLKDAHKPHHCSPKDPRPAGHQKGPPAKCSQPSATFCMVYSSTQCCRVTGCHTRCPPALHELSLDGGSTSGGGTVQAVLPPLALGWHCCFCSHTANQIGELIWLENCLFFFFCVCQVVFSQEQKLVEQAEIKKVLDS